MSCGNKTDLSRKRKYCWSFADDRQESASIWYGSLKAEYRVVSARDEGSTPFRTANLETGVQERSHVPLNVAAMIKSCGVRFPTNFLTGYIDCFTKNRVYSLFFGGSQGWRAYRS